LEIENISSLESKSKKQIGSHQKRKKKEEGTSSAIPSTHADSALVSSRLISTGISKAKMALRAIVTAAQTCTKKLLQERRLVNILLL
jgi:hypothetical protein